LTLGFNTVKDLLDVLVIPIVIFLVGALLPNLFEAVKTRKFLALIKRELGEMIPEPLPRTGQWHQHLIKRFIHKEIFDKVSENRDFILALPPDIAYNAKQLWTHFEKAMASQSGEDLAEHGAAWCDYLYGLCCFFDGRHDGAFHQTVYQPWEELVLEYHPELKENGRISDQRSCSKKV